ncbi:F-box/FBD/LRR-repeat protein At2g26030-like isoform X2 [Henckelia pumila]|uniref:F-box/FBD/LRR-repeat protein At2g26030-like isoform X2 n=1 Tax=Henckelia pumila TaxID=405737 RepID=UPI003C6DC5D5
MEESIQVGSNEDKKPRTTYVENGGEDIISDLPENIISRILSLLPTKDVIRTCVLSKDWEYKWTGIDNIDINDNERFSLKTTRKTSVVNFMDRIFILSRNSKLKRFHFMCQQKYDARRMITWISAALMRDVEDLEIVYKYEGVVIPRCIFGCVSLTNLKLQLRCTFRPVRNWFSNLKVMCLAEVDIVNEHAPDTTQLTFNFPVLETFKLYKCNWLKVNFVQINAPTLTKFYVEQHSDQAEVDNFQIKISGAKFLKFEFYGIRKNGLHARLLLKGCSDLNHLRLSGEIVEAMAKSNQGPPLPKLNMLKRLEIFTKCSNEAFLEFLHSTPSLEYIWLDMWLWNDYDYDSVEAIPSCIASQLIEVEFNMFKGERSHIHLADFLLKYAVRLKKMSGLSRKRSEERRVEKNFWARLKKVFGDGDFELDSSIKNMRDFERLFGQ